MLRYLILMTVLVLNLQSTTYGQLQEKELSKHVTLTVKDLIDLRLETLSAQITSGSLISEFGRIGFPVSFRIGNDLKVEFRIDGSDSKIDTLTGDIQKEVIREAMEIVTLEVTSLFNRKFRNIHFDPKSDLIGYWYSSHVPEPNAKWEHNKFAWLN